jgi:hypothetical protein
VKNAVLVIEKEAPRCEGKFFLALHLYLLMDSDAILTASTVKVVTINTPEKPVTIVNDDLRRSLEGSPSAWKGIASRNTLTEVGETDLEMMISVVVACPQGHTDVL